MDKIIGEIIKETPNDMELGAKIRELYPQITKEEVLSKEYLEHWTCDHCGKNTHEVEYDYLGNGTNHLQCDLIADDVMKNGILLGCHQGMKKNELDYICQTFLNFLKHCR